MNVALKLDSQHLGFLMRLHEAAEAIGARYAGKDILLQGVSTDTRTLQAGQLFIALRGPNFDGHDYVARAIELGAVACMVEHPIANSPALIVEDTRLALGQLARAWRRRFTLPIVAVTGSNGKTTVKEMLASIFARQGAMLATRGNLNNDIGVPLTLLGLDQSHTSAVVEMGANHPGEIAYLTGLTDPTVAIVTNAASAHLEGFGSLEGVAKAKGEIFQSLNNEGVAIINADDAYASLWQDLAGDRARLTFGVNNPADVSARWQAEATGCRIKASTPDGDLDIHLSLLGEHNVINALAAIAAAQAAGISLETIRAGLEAMQSVPGRLQLKAGINGSRIIDDTYNANPASLVAAIRVLADFDGEHILVLGDMGELGEDARLLHADAGRNAKQSGVHRLYTIGPMAAAAAQAFGEGAYRFEDQAAAIDALKDELDSRMTLLIKGSRLSYMERVVTALTGEEQN